VIALLFQNCDFVSDEIDADASAVDQSSADAMPFAFDVDIDQIAYMSCNGAGFNNPYFSFRAGGYESGSGVSLRENFLSQYGGYNDSRLSTLLNLSPRNSRTGVVMGVRDSGAFQNILTFQGDDNADNKSIDGRDMAGLMFQPTQTYTSSNVLSSILDQREGATNYLRGVGGLSDTRSFDGSINLFSVDDQPNTQPVANGFDERYRIDLENQAYLAFTFANSDLENVGERARSPFSATGESNEAQSSVWGKGYKFNFVQYDDFVDYPSVTFRPSSPERAVAQVTAFNLETESQLGENWVCPDDQKYVIVRRADALRRYDGVGVNASNHPFNQYDRVDPLDDESALDPTTSYDDGCTLDNGVDGQAPSALGGCNRGGYYYTYQADYDGNGELDYVRHKVLCPMMSDQIPLDTPANRDEISAWERVRRALPVEDWFVFRGSRYNCIVPKNDTGDACYAGSVNFNDGLDPSDVRNIIQYFADEDHPDIRIAHEREDVANDTPTSTVIIPEIETTRDCGPGSSTAHGGFNYCPQIVSICYRLN